MLRVLKGVFILSIFVLLTSKLSLAADLYTIDPAHSTIGFSTTHMMVSQVKGEFADYAGTIQFDKADPKSFSAEATIKTASIDTRQPKRDEHLKSADFFDAEKYPTITFKSKALTAQGEDYVMAGDLTMHGVTKEISIPVKIMGPVAGMKGGKLIGMTGTTKINRQDFGVSWNKTLDSGGYVVSDDVVIDFSVEADAK